MATLFVMLVYSFCYLKSPHCHSELVEESHASTTHFVRKIIHSYNLIVSIYALLLFFKIPRSLRFLGMTGCECFLKLTILHIRKIKHIGTQKGRAIFWDCPTLKLSVQNDLSCFAFNLHNDIGDVLSNGFLFRVFTLFECSWLENKVKSVGSE